MNHCWTVSSEALHPINVIAQTAYRRASSAVARLELAMPSRSLKAEARHCRELAQQFVGRSEEMFLLSVANGFEQLADQRMKPTAGSIRNS